MTYAEHLENSRALLRPQRDNLLRSLARDDRFSAIVGWLEHNREAFIQGGSRQELAQNHGKLAHAQGSVHALNMLTAQLANLLALPDTTGTETQPEE